MSASSKIEWTDASLNPIRARPRPGEKLVGDPGWKSGRLGGKPGWYCEHLSEGCRNCYAEGMNHRLGTGIDFQRQNRDRVEIFLDEKMLTAPLRWKRPRRVFVCSMTDLFADFVKDEWIDKVFAVMALAPRHTYQVLTKRPERMRHYVSQWFKRLATETVEVDHPAGRANFASLVDWAVFPAVLPNVWLGVSAERQQEADERREPLRALAGQGWTTFCSFEPALGPIDWAGWKFLRWLISGGESGRNARASHPDWHRASRDWCETHRVAYFFKQWGEWAPNIGAVDGWTLGDNPEVSDFDHREWEDGRWSEAFRPSWCDFSGGNYDEGQCVLRIGKKAAGRLLDGVEHSAFPR